MMETIKWYVVIIFSVRFVFPIHHSSRLSHIYQIDVKVEHFSIIHLN